MTVSLLYSTPLWVCAKSIRKCWASEDKSDTTYDMKCEFVGEQPEAGEADKALILRVGNKNKHASTLEHLNYSFDIDGISRACLQELARHRHASMSVKSSRYTLKELKEATNEELTGYLVQLDDWVANKHNVLQLVEVRKALQHGVANDKVKYMLPEAYKTSLVWTINARSLQNFLALRTNKAALWEIQDLARAIYKELPEEHKYLFEDFVSAKGDIDD